MSDAPHPPDLTLIAAAAQRLLTDDESLAVSLHGVAEAGCALLEGCAAASITILQTTRPVTIAATSDVATAIDAAQYAEDDGPCLSAAREERIIRVADAIGETEWPAYAKAAAEQDVRSSLSIPLELPGPDTYGGLNFYGSELDAFTDADQRVAESFGKQAGTVVSNAIAYWRALDQAASLTLAMQSRADIEQAKGILMATQRCSPDEAFDLLRRASQRENRKLHEIAVEIVVRATTGEL